MILAAKRLRPGAAACLLLGLPPLTFGCAPAASQTVEFAKGSSVTLTARGTFQVQMTRLGEPQESGGITLGRFLNEKRFAGDLVGQSRGEMVTVMTPVENSAGYVLIERVQAELGGRVGSFVLQHSSTVARGIERQSIVVVPDSGTGGLVGLGRRLISSQPQPH